MFDTYSNQHFYFRDDYRPVAKMVYSVEASRNAPSEATDGCADVSTMRIGNKVTVEVGTCQM